MLRKIPEEILEADEKSQTPLYRILTHPENPGPLSEAEKIYIDHQLKYFSLDFYSTISCIVTGIGYVSVNGLKKNTSLVKDVVKIKKSKIYLGGFFAGINLMIYSHYQRKIRKLDFENDLKVKWRKQLKDLKLDNEIKFD